MWNVWRISQYNAIWCFTFPLTISIIKQHVRTRLGVCIVKIVFTILLPPTPIVCKEETGGRQRPTNQPQALSQENRSKKWPYQTNNLSQLAMRLCLKCSKLGLKRDPGTVLTSRTMQSPWPQPLSSVLPPGNMESVSTRARGPVPPSQTKRLLRPLGREVRDLGLDYE